MDVDEKAPLLSVATCAETLLVQGSGRGGKPKLDTIKAAGLAGFVGKRARKGHKVEGFVKVQRVI